MRFREWGDGIGPRFEDGNRDSEVLNVRKGLQPICPKYIHDMRSFSPFCLGGKMGWLHKRFPMARSAEERITLSSNMCITQVAPFIHPTYIYIYQTRGKNSLLFPLTKFSSSSLQKMAKEFLNRYVRLENSIEADVGQHCVVVSLSVLSISYSSPLHVCYI